MSVKVFTSRHGKLGIRIYLKGREFPIVGTKYVDTPKNRSLVEAKARLIDDQIDRGKQVHEAVIEILGDCPIAMIPGIQERARKPRAPLVEDFAKWWLDYLEEAAGPRKSLMEKARIYTENVIAPWWKGKTLAEVTPATLIEFQKAMLAKKKSRGEGPIKVKTAKNIVAGHFQAMIRKAMKVHGLPERDPFPALEWPKKTTRADPDPFLAEDRDKILAYFAAPASGHYFDRHRALWYPWVAMLLWTGLRMGESIGLRWGDLDRTEWTLRVRVSRTLHEENDPKTLGSARTIKLLPQAIEALKKLPEPLHPGPDAYLFVNPEGEPINSKEWPKKSFYPVLRKLGIRQRRFYCTRHTFITEMIGRGENLKAIAEYVGTSVRMIEESYGRWLVKGTDPTVKILGGTPKVGTFFDTSEETPKTSAISRG